MSNVEIVHHSYYVNELHPRREPHAKCTLLLNRVSCPTCKMHIARGLHGLDEALIRTSVEPLVGNAFIVNTDYQPTLREKVFGRKKS